MTIENGGEQPANDTAIAIENDTTQAAQNTEQAEGEDTEGDKPEGETLPEDIEVEYEGQKFKVPPVIKDALLRQSDYTRKTQELAEARKALEAQQEGVKGQAETQKAVHTEAVKVAALDERLAEYEKVDWNTLFATNPELFHQHRFAREQIKEQRDAASRSLEQKQGQLREHANREYGERVSKTQAEIARLIPEWTPGGELDLKLQKYGNELGFSNEDLAQTTLRNPKFVQQLKRLHDFDQAAKKQKTQQTFDQAQQAKPVTRVGGNGGTASQRKTTDSSGDGLSTEEWIRRENERVANQRKAMGRR